MSQARRRADGPTNDGPRSAAHRWGLVRPRIAARFANLPVRASPSYRFEPAGPGQAPESGSWAGALVPAGPGWRRSQLVSPETIALFRSLSRPARLPPEIDVLAAARLVLDGILEIETDAGFLSGPFAHPCLGFPAARNGKPAGGVIARLSRAALHQVAAVGIADPSIISRLLYRFNSLPASPGWRARFPDDASVARLYETMSPRHVRGWTSFLTTPEAGVWWRAWDWTGAATPAGSAPTYKLYVSPAPESVGEACRAVLGLGRKGRGGPFSVKAGNNLPSILRPEKLVAYFLTRDDLHTAAARLADRIGGMRAQGVPFTAGLSRDGLLSWGMDPGTAAEPPGPLRQLSWRRWITARLAGAVATAVAAGRVVAPDRFARDRIALEGVDPERWTAPAWFAPSGRTDADH